MLWLVEVLVVGFKCSAGLANLAWDQMFSVAFGIVRNHACWDASLVTMYRAVSIHPMYPFDKAGAWQAFVARLDDEVEAKSMLQAKLAALEIAGSASTLAGSATTLAAPGSWVRADVGGADNVSLILANFETERKIFEETRKVRDR